MVIGLPPLELLSVRSHWAAWNREFILRADAAHLWHEKINPDNLDDAGNSLLKPFEDMPVAPDPTKYDKRIMPGQDSATIVVSTTPEGIEAGTIVDPAACPNNAHEMTVNSRAAYAADLVLFNTRLAIYRHEDQAHKELKHWILSTVSDRLAEITCKPGESVDVWYNALRGRFVAKRPQKDAAAAPEGTSRSKNKVE
ncbi:uncharacterized protein B0H64DRAFT_45960 [Chaetomium fimeti]|uniref:Uncharacterized protein n=1 Tax=Chaetomium fimeti TaxID=1854472 RepID=A0AAE0H7D6_9PEZI|nr:hypothetical protein B0H64DRAFT_45960 [Chaetomium fimeti]